MEYKVEALKNRNLYFNRVINASSPTNAVRKVSDAIKIHTNIDNYIIYIMNKAGDVWMYHINNNISELINKASEMNKAFIINIFTGNSNISGVLQ